MDWDNVKSGIIFVVGLVLCAVGVILVVASIFGFANDASERACSAKWEGTMKVQYSFYGGCRVFVPGKGWMPSDNYRNFD